MRRDGQEMNVGGKRQLGFSGIVGISRWNREARVGHAGDKGALSRRRFGEHQPDLRSVGTGLSVGGVVDLEDKIRACADAERGVGRQVIRLSSWRVAH